MNYLIITLLDEDTISVMLYIQGFKCIGFLPNNLIVAEQLREWFLHDSN